MKVASQLLLTKAGRALKQLKYYNMGATAMIAIGKQLLKSGGNCEKAGQHVIVGVIEGLGAEKDQKFGVCPFCGRRHPSVTEKDLARRMSQSSR